MTDYTSKFDSKMIGVASHAQQNPQKPALVMNNIVVTWRELDKKTNALGNTLLQLGVSPGDHIAMLFYNSPEILQVWSAAGKIGVTPVGLNYRFKQDELAYVINNSESKLLLYSYEFEEVISAVKSKINVPSLRYISFGGPTSSESLDIKKLLNKADDTPPQIDTGARGVASSLTYTSGTTGRPKGVFKTSKNRLNNLLGYAYYFESTYDDTHLVAAPLYHAAPYAWAAFSLILGNTLIIMPRFDSENFLSLIQEHQVTTTFVVPTMLNRILNLPSDVRKRYDISTLRVMTVAGESFPFPLKKKVVEYFQKTRIFEYLGGTEIGTVTYLPPEDQLRKPGSCGKPFVSVDIKLLDENKNEVPAGEPGIMYIKSDFLLDGYYNDSKATNANYYNGYFTVGDVARVDEEGYYYVVDRAVDMILSGGVNIYPAEIEEVLYSHPGVYDASVVGAPDPDWGEKTIAYVVPKANTKLQKEALIEYVGEKLASYKKPKELIFIDEIPYTSSGKQLKRVLRDEYIKRSQ
jgi:long-chain acyl-CoA synthetase